LFHEIISVGYFDTIIVAGDLNAQYPNWGSTRRNFTGVSFKEYLSSHHSLSKMMDVELSANISHINWPDVTLVKSNSYIFSWNTGENLLGSNNLLIKIYIKE